MLTNADTTTTGGQSHQGSVPTYTDYLEWLSLGMCHLPGPFLPDRLFAELT